MSRVERMKRGMKYFLQEQYDEFAPKRVKSLASKLKAQQPRVRDSYRTRSARGRVFVRNFISKQTAKLPLPRRKRRKK